MYIENTECKLLSNGLKLPLMGLGTFGIPKRDFTNAMISAAQCDFRLMNTTDNYNNELFLGRGVNNLLKVGKYKKTDFLVRTKNGDISPYFKNVWIS